MSRRKKPNFAGTSRNFRSIGGALSRGEERLKQQADINIQSIKLAKEQHKEATNIHTKGLADKANFEERTVRREKDRLAGLIRNRQQEALSIKADRDVAALKGKATEAEKLAKSYAALIPKTAQLIEQSGKFGLALGEKLATWDKLNEINKKGLMTNPLDANQDALNKVNAASFMALDKENPNLDPNSKEYFTARKNLNWLGVNSEVFNLWSDNENIEKKAVFALANQIAQEEHKEKRSFSLNQYNSDDFFRYAGMLRLEELGISPTSKHGARILARYERWGTNHANNIRDAQATEKTETSIAASAERFQGIRKLGIFGGGKSENINKESLTQLVHGDIQTLQLTGVVFDKDSKTYIRLGDTANAQMNTTVHYIVEIAKKKGHLYDRETFLEDAFGTVLAFPRNGVKSKERLIDKISPSNIELIEKAVQQSHDNKTTARDNDSKNEGNVLKSKYENATAQWQLLNKGKYDQETKKFIPYANPGERNKAFHDAGLPETLPELKHYWTREIMSSTAPDNVKVNLLKKLELASGNAKASDIVSYLDVMSPLNDYTLEGDAYIEARDAMTLKYSGLDASIQKRIAPMFKRFQDVDKANFTHDRTKTWGITSWRNHFKDFVGEADGAPGSGRFTTKRTAHVDRTAEKVASHMTVRAETLFHKLLPSYIEKYGDTPKAYHEARVEAFRTVEGEHANNVEGSLYHREKKGFGGGWRYTNPIFDPSGGEAFTILEIEARKRGEDGTSPLSRFNNTVIDGLQRPEDIKAVDAAGLLGNPISLFDRADIFSPHALTAANKLAARMMQPYEPLERFTGDVTYELPEETVTMSKTLSEILTRRGIVNPQTKKRFWTVMDVINYAMSKQELDTEYRFSADGETATMLQNGKWVHEDDRFGSSIFGSIVNNGWPSPKKEHIRLNFQEGLDTKTSFFQSHDIKIDELTGNIFDPEDAINKSVLNQPFMDEETLQQIFPFGLTGIPKEYLNIKGQISGDLRMLLKQKPKHEFRIQKGEQSIFHVPQQTEEFIEWDRRVKELRKELKALGGKR